MDTAKGDVEISKRRPQPQELNPVPPAGCHRQHSLHANPSLTSTANASRQHRQPTTALSTGTRWKIAVAIQHTMKIAIVLKSTPGTVEPHCGINPRLWAWSNIMMTTGCIR